MTHQKLPPLEIGEEVAYLLDGVHRRRAIVESTRSDEGDYYLARDPGLTACTKSYRRDHLYRADELPRLIEDLQQAIGLARIAIERAKKELAEKKGATPFHTRAYV